MQKRSTDRVGINSERYYIFGNGNGVGNIRFAALSLLPCVKLVSIVESLCYLLAIIIFTAHIKRGTKLIIQFYFHKLNKRFQPFDNLVWSSRPALLCAKTAKQCRLFKVSMLALIVDLE